MRSVVRRSLDRIMAAAKPKLEDLSKEQLIARIYELERQLPPQSRRPPQTLQNPFPFSKHPTRKIALKFTYAGWLYNGLAAQSQPTPLATVEQVLFDALVNTRLVDPDKGMEGCGWSRCGRTDRGVSSAGQVVSLWVRSALSAGSFRAKNESLFDKEDSEMAGGLQEGIQPTMDAVDSSPLTPQPISSDRGSSPLAHPLPPTLPAEACSRKQEMNPELAYIHMLNRVLPATIRVLAWSPVADDFDARFSCQWRHYKYFFSKAGRALDGIAAAGAGRADEQINVPGGAGTRPGRARGVGLDISAMQDAATRLIGEHDFRNFCKLDPSKQIENFNRRVLEAWIEPVEDDQDELNKEGPGIKGKQVESDEELYVFNLKGTAFLWHQVRCIMAILLLVGQRLEDPSIVDRLLHTSLNSSKSLDSPPIESKPNYTLADSLPLVLWDCGYKPEDVAWQTDPIAQTKQGVAQDREKTHNFWFDMYSIWTHDRIQTTMQRYFLRASERFYPTPASSANTTLVRLNTGGGVYRHTTRYTPILELDRGERAEVANAKWREGTTGQRRMAKRNTKSKNTHDD
ncbi:Pseudouridine synthase [Rhizoctonia solani]|uniref:Pseudouridine synthase n=1 Tax=Rhizoctonia solani TaxID=456999 RepID=A0A8H7H129_9AGAM|nr:Pseudouridine synthase [Rhizoctonia solani]